MKNLVLATIVFILCSACKSDYEMPDDIGFNLTMSYPIVGTNQTLSFNNRDIIGTVSEGVAFYGQNSNYQGNIPSYTDNGDGTVTDNVTGLMWSKSPDLNGDGIINYDDKISLEESEQFIKEFALAGYTDWRIPTIKELYSLIDFSGIDISSYSGTSTEGLTPFIDTRYFDFGYGDLSYERLIDAQMLTTTIYTSTTMENAKTLFGVNFADGRIKGYGLTSPKGEKKFYAYFVRGNSDYGKNDFVETEDETIVDKATGLMWMKDDSGKGMTWQEALEYAENYSYGGYDDWRLPSVKELQSIVDYDRSPSFTSSAAISPLFNCTQITNEAGQKDYPAYWSSTTHQRYASDRVGINACYVCFGRAMGYMGRWIDVHGAGAQRSDPKNGNPNDYPNGFGPQGDAIRIYNYVRLVRNAETD